MVLDAKNIKVVLIDDEHGVLRALELMITAILKCSVITFSDPVKATESLSNIIAETVNQKIIVVSDLRMPIMDGFAVLEFINSKFPEIPFILISGHVTEVEEKQVLERGAKGVLKKPFAPDKLSNLFAQLFSE